MHPDRFRSQPTHVIKQQSHLIQLLSDRLAEPDFLRYITPTVSLDQLNDTQLSEKYGQQIEFSFETKTNGVVKTSIALDGNPTDILQCMAELCNFPSPPSPPPQLSTDGRQSQSEPDFFQFLRYGALRPKKRAQNNYLLQFLQADGLVDDIKERQLNRIDATAAAYVARQLYKFKSIDGTRLGWSSKSMAICLQRLAALHDEHMDKFQTKSFYPFRLIISSDEFQRKVDLFSGDIRLNPASTSVQWLSILQNVTSKCVETLKTNQQILKANLSIVEDDIMQLRVVKGHTCDAEDYFECIRRLARQSEEKRGALEDANESRPTILSSKATLVIESDQTCRIGTLRKDGNFVVPTSMSINGIRRTISKYANRSNEILNAESRMKKQCDLLVQKTMNEFEVQKVNKSNIVSNDQMIQCLNVLLAKGNSEKDALRELLGGHIIGVSKGGKTHLADDGSIIIPWNLSS